MKTFLVMKAGMGLGGIETYIYKMAKWILAHDGRVIFLAIKGTTYADTFYDLFTGECELHNIDIHDPMWQKHLDLHFSANEEVIAYTFSFYAYALMERLRYKYIDTSIHSFFWIPHYSGKNIFPELEFPPIIRGACKRYIRRIYAKMDKNNNIVYVNQSHRDAVIKNYRFGTVAYPSQIIRFLGDTKPLDSVNLKERARREQFNIITVSRFVFPHKGYLMGLIEAFSILAEEYEHLHLTIIGDGAEKDRRRVIAAIEELSESVRSRIHLEGAVEYNRLEQYFKHAHLNIGVATTICDGALCGVISIPVRHESYTCEGYGFLPESRDSCVSIQKGNPIIPYIETVIRFSETEFIAYSKMAYDTYARDDVDEYWKGIIANTNVNEKQLLPRAFCGLVQLRYVVSGLFAKLRRK